MDEYTLYRFDNKTQEWRHVFKCNDTCILHHCMHAAFNEISEINTWAILAPMTIESPAMLALDSIRDYDHEVHIISLNEDHMAWKLRS